jgi:LacI family transcriptional regulator
MSDIEKNQYSIKDISRISGVSIATLSRFFNGQSVRPSNVEKIKKVLEETGYRPSIAARFIKGHNSGVIGLIVPEITHPFFALIAEGVMREARNQGKLVLLGSSEGSMEIEKQIIDRFSQSILDGLIYIPVAKAENIPALEIFRNIPLVVTARKGIIPGVPHVYHDGEYGGYLATKHLISLGRRNIAFIASFWDIPCSNIQILENLNKPSFRSFSSIDRFMGYIKALDEAGIPYNPDLVVVTGYGHKHGVEAVSVLKSRFVECNGVVTMTQAVANGFTAQAKRLGYRIPEDVSVVLFDANESKADYTFTYIELHLVKMGQESVRALHELIQGMNVEDTCLAVELRVRETSMLLPMRPST